MITTSLISSSSASTIVSHAADSLSRITSLERAVYGDNSELIDQIVNVGGELAQRRYITDVLSYKIFIIIFVILYFIWIGRSLANISETSFRISNPFAKITESQGLVKSFKVGDLLLNWTLVVALCMLFVTRVIELLHPHNEDIEGLAIHINNIGMWSWLLLIGAVFLAMLIWSNIVVMVGCYLLRRESMTPQLFTLKSRLLKMSIIWLLPIVFLSSFEQINLTMSYIATIVAFMFIAIYLFRSYLLFMSQKISILHWILYLCAVELFPITLLWAYFVR